MQDRYGLLPPVIAHNYEREEMVDRHLQSAIALHAALVALDSKLDLVFINDRADPEYGVKPGRWHVVRKNDPPAPDTYIAITTPDGGYREPDSGVLHELHSRDTWKTGIDSYVRPTPAAEPKTSREQLLDAAMEDVVTAARIPGDGGMEKRLWGRGRK